jgi:polysaccharide pyruvyl transferase WcaK-like protein
LASNNVIILGGGLSNKGAQAMTFTAVDQIKRRFPDKDIYLFSTEDFERPETVKALYTFDFMPWTPKGRIKLLLGSWTKDRSKHACKHKEIQDVLQNTCFIIDISGYVLSSQWPFSASLGYLINILIAKKYSIPFYVFPQSFGPFDYPWQQKLILYPLLKICLRYPKKIFMRETAAFEYAQKFTKSNVEQSHDIVLQNTEYHLSNIYSKEMSFKNVPIVPNSVGVIPSVRVAEKVNPNLFFDAYQSMIQLLVGNGVTVYILRHSQEDLKICMDIKDLFHKDEQVKLIQDDLNAIELENLLEQFDFVIASRYHAIIHSYKKGVPVLIIGWARKYSELVREFGQTEYYFDCKAGIDSDELKAGLNRMINNRASEKQKIMSKAQSISHKNIFDILKNDIAGC